MRLLIILLLFLVCLNPAHSDANWPACGRVDHFPGESWQITPPTSLGWNEIALAAARARFEELDSEAMMVVHRGHLVARWGNVEERFQMASLRKSVLSALYGALDQRMDLNLDLTVADLAVLDTDPPLSTAQRRASIQDLVSSRSGVYHSAHYEMGSWKRLKSEVDEWASEQFDEGSPPPGSVWLYNNWDFNLAGWVPTLLTGKPLGPLFKVLVANPLKMQDFRGQDVSYVGDGSYAERRMGNLSAIPAWMFHMSTRDLARIGLAYLNCGRWGARQVLSEKWVRDSVKGRWIGEGAPDTENAPQQYMGSYGYLWWVDKPSQPRSFRELPLREPVYIGQGYRGHIMLVAPFLDLVVVHQVASRGDMSTASQLKRRFFGSPEVDDSQFQALMRLLIAAHPEGANALDEGS